MRSTRNKAQRLRTVVELLPRETREAMLHGISSNDIIVGGYTDRDGGICPMLAAHRNGGRTNYASFALAWDAFTGAGKRSRRASKREIRALRSYLEMSVLAEDTRGATMAELADGIRSERRAAAERAAAEPPQALPPELEDDLVRVRPGDRNRTRELRLRDRWGWVRPTRNFDIFEATVAAAQEQLSEQRAADVLGDPAAPTEARR